MTIAPLSATGRTMPLATVTDSLGLYSVTALVGKSERRSEAVTVAPLSVLAPLSRGMATLTIGEACCCGNELLLAQPSSLIEIWCSPSVAAIEEPEHAVTRAKTVSAKRNPGPRKRTARPGPRARFPAASIVSSTRK